MCLLSDSQNPHLRIFLKEIIGQVLMVVCIRSVTARGVLCGTGWVVLKRLFHSALHKIKQTLLYMTKEKIQWADPFFSIHLPGVYTIQRCL